VRETTEELVALTDDDAEAPPDWLKRMAKAMEDPAVGGVGGRDWQPHERWDEPGVGTRAWYGRVVGNHHLGAGAARDVELLKGVNCCFRGDELRRIGFDSRLRGRGNVSNWEMSLCFAFRRAGWRLIYDPTLAIDHHVAARQDGDVNARGGFERESYIDGVHNEVLAVSEALGMAGRMVYPTWLKWVGTRGTPGVAQVLRLWARGERSLAEEWERYSAVREGVRLARATLRGEAVDKKAGGTGVGGLAEWHDRGVPTVRETR
jgi:hypothetical protein